jgi:hypothetical protein
VAAGPLLEPGLRLRPVAPGPGTGTLSAPGGRRCQVVVHGLGPPDGRIDGQQGTTLCRRLGHPLAALVIRQQAKECGRELTGTTRGDQQALPTVLDHLGDTAHGRGDHWQAEGEGLHDRHPEALVEGRQHEHVACGHDPHGVGTVPHEQEPIAQPQPVVDGTDLRFERTLAHGHEPDVG